MEDVLLNLLRFGDNNWMLRYKYEKCLEYWIENKGKYVNADTGCIFDSLILGYQDRIRLRYEPV